MTLTENYFVVRTLGALELLADQPRTSNQIADELAIHPRTARRMLSRLVDEHYAHRTPGPRPIYSLTPRFYALAARGLLRYAQHPPGTTEPADQDRDTLEQQLHTALHTLQLAWLRDHTHMCVTLNVGSIELHALLHLLNSGQTTPRALSVATGLSAAGTSALLIRLRELGLIHVRAEPTNRNRRTVALSDQGRARVQAATQLHQSRITAATADTDTNELASAVQLITTIAAAPAR